MVFNIVLGFLLLVTASYIGTTMALRKFFGRKHYNSESKQFTTTEGDNRREEADGQ